MKKEAFLDSIYTMEPKSSISKWDMHWNYQWGSRTDVCGQGQCKWRKEKENQYIVQDKDGVIWIMDEEAFNEFKEEIKQ